MNKEDLYIKQLMQELPKEKAPDKLTQLIMGKIEEKITFSITPPTPIWKTQNFYILIGIIFTELYLLLYFKDTFTINNLVFILKNIYVNIVRYSLMLNLQNIILGVSIIVITVYLIVKERIDYVRSTQFSNAFFSKILLNS